MHNLWRHILHFPRLHEYTELAIVHFFGALIKTNLTTDLKINNCIGLRRQKNDADFEITAAILVWSSWDSQNKVRE